MFSVFLSIFSRIGLLQQTDHMIKNLPCWRASSLLFPHWDFKTKRLQPVKCDWPYVLMSHCKNNNELALQHGGFCTM